tara:strand:+ start:2198 stop:3373 length:1176 start_codon:yes stop_codon:yes gene_type:complete
MQLLLLPQSGTPARFLPGLNSLFLDARARVILVAIVLSAALVALLAAQPAIANDMEPLEYADPLRLRHLPPSFYDFPAEEMDLEPREGVWLDSSNWVMHQRDVQAGRIENLGDWLDQVLSGEAIRAPSNESYLRIGFATRAEKSNWMDFEPEARFKLDLPTVKEKFRLVVENAPDELVPLRERDEDRRLIDSERSESETTGALRYLAPLSERWSVSNDLGVRFRIPVNPFWRTQLRADWELDDDWTLDVEQRFFYFHTDGWGERTELVFSRYFAQSLQLSVRSDLQWVHREREFEWTQAGYLDHFVDHRNQITYRLGVNGDNRPGWRSTEFYVDAAWRRRLHDDWLYAEVIPALEFPREDNFRENPSLTLRIEVFFSSDDYTPYERRFQRY